MAARKKRLLSLVITLALLGLNLLALNYLLAGWSGARLDLTSERLYSISPATKRLLTSLDEELTITGYFSGRTHPKLAPLVPELTDLLDEYAIVSGGKVHAEIIDPGGNEEVEQEAADRYGVRSTPFRLASKYESGIVNAYFAVVVKYADQYVRYGFEDLIQIDPTPDGDVDVRLRNPEYDLTRAIKKVVYGFRSTNELFERIDRPARLTAIWTPERLPEIFKGVPEALRTAAKELGERGGEKFVFEEIDPAGKEDVAADVYRRFGARPMSTGFFGGGEDFYLYAVLDAGGQVEQVPLTGESLSAGGLREAIENSLRRHTAGFLKTVGLAAPDPPSIPPELRMQMQLPPQEPPEYEEVKRFLGEDYQVRDVALDSEPGIPSEVDLLLILEPQRLSQKAVYHVDQYLMRGGRVIVCAGGYDVNFGAGGMSLTPLETGLDDWLAHHGVSVGKTLVLDDRNQPLPIPEVRQTPFGAMRSWVLAPYPYLVQVREDGFMNPEITASLDAVGIYWGSPLTVDPETTKSLKVIPILQSSKKSWTSDDLSRAQFVDYEVPAEGTEPHLLAVALTGKFKSFFAGKEPPAAGSSAEPSPSQAVTIEESPETRLVVVGDSEFLSDFVARTLARVEGGFFLENLRFAQNLIDWSSLDNDMLEIRSRGALSRRLDRLDRGTEIAIETANWVIPFALLLGLGAWRYWRRKHTLPLGAADRRELTEAPASRGEI